MNKPTTIEVLGCSGSIGIPSEGTTSFLVDDDILVDAGTGVCRLEFDRLEKITDLILTHSHLDHITALPFVLDTVGVVRDRPLMVYGIQHTIDALKDCIFNNRIWPDFTKIPSADKPVLQYTVIEPYSMLQFGHRAFRTLPVPHTVPAIAVILDTAGGSWAFSGDTHVTDELYQVLNATPQLKYFFLEAAFPDREKWLADLAKHLCPSLVFEEVQKLQSDCAVWISHLKPREFELIKSELQSEFAPRRMELLQSGQVFVL